MNYINNLTNILKLINDYKSIYGQTLMELLYWSFHGELIKDVPNKHLESQEDIKVAKYLISLFDEIKFISIEEEKVTYYFEKQNLNIYFE